ncbi:MAG: hypothetical protein Q7J28_02980 [Caulobacter sp.]|nr:hypothetical protein [Caulobacter sp.]
MSESEKGVLSTVSPADVDAMAEIVKRVREIPGWDDRRDGLVLQGTGGTLIEVTKHEGSEHGVIVVLTPKSEG